MKLSELARKPQLVEVTIDTPEIIEEYGEPLTFHTLDRQPMDVFLRMASMTQDNYAEIVNCVRDLILTETGEPMLADGAALPPRVIMAVVGVVIDGLGK